MDQVADFGTVFARLKQDGQREQTFPMGGVNVRLVRITGGGAGGKFDSHAATAETVVVWSGDFSVHFRDGVQDLVAGQCCVVGKGVEHFGTSKEGAEVVLFQTAH